VPIDGTNFDNASIATAVPFTSAPAAPGATDGIAVTNLYIEKGYYFAVRALDGAGNSSAIVATGTATTAKFNVANIPSTSGTNEQFGHNVTAGDFNGDGLTDIAVATTNASKAYIFFGSPTFGVTPPAVTITGAIPAFGFNVTAIGDVDHDGIEDLAISDSTVNERVYIYKGRTTWPATLTDADATYTISTDASYATSFFGFSMARLGDFTGEDGVDDFAIGVRSYAGSIGRVVIIRGKTGFGSVTLPDTTNAITIDGDATLGSSLFGYRVLGVGHFYSVPGTTMIVSAPGTTPATLANPGHVYAFHGQTALSGSIAVSAADNVIAGPGTGAKIGTVLTNLGTMFNGFPGVGIGNLVDTIDIPGGHGGAYLTSGAPGTGPFSLNHIAYLAGASASGGVLIGGGLLGSDQSVSIIGDATPDLVFAGELGTSLTINDGAKLGAKASPTEVGSTAEVVLTLPSGWASGEGDNRLIKDLNGDGFADFCLGSQLQPGAVVVYW
jgi:hypothetical protein